MQTKQEKQCEALERGRRYRVGGNDLRVITEFQGRGMNPHDIETFGPDQNVWTYDAWQALGRQVRKGEKSVRITVYGSYESKERNEKTGEPIIKSCRSTACLFHITQTDAIAERVVA